MNNKIILTGDYYTSVPKSPTYTFCSQPRALFTTRKKYRSPQL